MNEKLTAYALNELPPEERAALETQMKNDPKLREEAEEMKVFCAMLGKELHPGSVEDTLKPEQRTKLVQSFQTVSAERKVVQPSRLLWRRPAVLSGLGLAAAACVAVLIGVREVNDHPELRSLGETRGYKPADLKAMNQTQGKDTTSLDPYARAPQATTKSEAAPHPSEKVTVQLAPAEKPKKEGEATRQIVMNGQLAPDGAKVAAGNAAQSSNELQRAVASSAPAAMPAPAPLSPSPAQPAKPRQGSTMQLSGSMKQLSVANDASADMPSLAAAQTGRSGVQAQRGGTLVPSAAPQELGKESLGRNPAAGAAGGGRTTVSVGTGTVTLGGSNSYTGTSATNQGTLAINSASPAMPLDPATQLPPRPPLVVDQGHLDYVAPSLPASPPANASQGSLFGLARVDDRSSTTTANGGFQNFSETPFDDRAFKGGGVRFGDSAPDPFSFNGSVQTFADQSSSSNNLIAASGNTLSVDKTADGTGALFYNRQPPKVPHLAAIGGAPNDSKPNSLGFTAEGTSLNLGSSTLSSGQSSLTLSGGDTIANKTGQDITDLNGMTSTGQIKSVTATGTISNTGGTFTKSGAGTLDLNGGVLAMTESGARSGTAPIQPNSVDGLIAGTGTATNGTFVIAGAIMIPQPPAGPTDGSNTYTGGATVIGGTTVASNATTSTFGAGSGRTEITAGGLTLTSNTANKDARGVTGKPIPDTLGLPSSRVGGKEKAFADALQDLTAAQNQPDQTPASQVQREVAAKAYSQAATDLARERARNGHYKDARSLLSDALAKEPESETAKKLLKELDAPVQFEVAGTPEHAKNTDGATPKLAEAASNQQRAKMLNEVNANWEDSVPIKFDTAQAPFGSAAPASAAAPATAAPPALSQPPSVVASTDTEPLKAIKAARAKAAEAPPVLETKERAQIVAQLDAAKKEVAQWSGPAQVTESTDKDKVVTQIPAKPGQPKTDTARRSESKAADPLRPLADVDTDATPQLAAAKKAPAEREQTLQRIAQLEQRIAAYDLEAEVREAEAKTQNPADAEYEVYRKLMNQTDELKKEVAALPEKSDEYVTKDNELRGKYRELREFERRINERRTNVERERQIAAEQERLRLMREEADRRAAEERARQEAANSTATYRHIVENPFKLVTREPLSTFSLDVDTASYSNVRRFLDSHQRPPADAVRLEELINYFPYPSYQEPKGDAPFSVKVDMATAPWQPLHRIARVAVRGREVKRDQRQAANFTFLLDVSGSMSPPERLPLVKQALRLLVDQLREDDRVSIVTYAGESGLALDSTPGDQKEKIIGAIEKLNANGSTNGAGGIRMAYQQAVQHFKKNGINRVILCTDGDFNVGTSNVQELERLIADKAKTGVFLSVLGVGTDNLHDHTMQTLADRGNGNYHYLDSLSEARKILVEQMTGTLVTIAKDVKVQVEFNPAQVAAYRLIGYEKRALAKEDFNNDKKDAGEIGAGHTVTALFEIIPASLKYSDGTPVVDDLKYGKPATTAIADAPAKVTEPAPQNRETMTVKLRYKEPSEDTSKLINVPVTDAQKTLSENDKDFQFAVAVASFGMLLRESPYGAEMSWDSVRELAKQGKGRDEEGYRGEFLQLIDKARGFYGNPR